MLKLGHCAPFHVLTPLMTQLGVTFDKNFADSYHLRPAKTRGPGGGRRVEMQPPHWFVNLGAGTQALQR